MFYKSSNRSTVLDRQPTQSNDHQNPTEDRMQQSDLVDANRRADEAKKSKLSVFEKELLQAWFQDQQRAAKVRLDYNLPMPEIAATGAPDWQTITHDVLCPLCGYNLRGLSEARCPECGYRFEWVEVTDPETRPHAYLFEHHPERNVRSFLLTIWGTLRPIKFWRSMSPAQPSRPRRLFAYWFLTTLLTLPFLGASWLSAVVSSWDDFTYTYVRRMRGFIPVTRNSTEFSWSHLWENMKRTWAHSEIVDIALFLTLFWIAWPLLMLCALSIFQISMTQAKIRSIHVLRCLIYTYDIGAPLAWLGAAAILLSIWLPQLARWRGLETQQLLMLALLVLVTFRLWVAYRCYLRFRHALATVVLSQIVGILFAMALAMIFEQIVSAIRHW